jgi:hypothetical protein
MFLPLPFPLPGIRDSIVLPPRYYAIKPYLRAGFGLPFPVTLKRSYPLNWIQDLLSGVGNMGNRRACNAVPA